jgi:hypothetical protein
MRDERNPDSVLFDIKRVAEDVSEKPAARVGTKKPKPESEDESSGLIDVKKVLSETKDDQPARSPVLDHLAPPRPDAPDLSAHTNDGVGRLLIMASIVVLLCVVGILAVKAMG